MPGICSRCFSNVYFAEEKLALGKVWHDRCFSCRNCGKLLNSWSVTTYDDDLYCQKCCPKPKSIQRNCWQSKGVKSMYFSRARNDYGDPEICISKSVVDQNFEQDSEYGANSSCQYSISPRDELSDYYHKTDLDGSSAEIHGESDSSGSVLEVFRKHSTPCKVSFDQEECLVMMENTGHKDSKKSGIEGYNLIEEKRLRGGSGCRCSQNCSNSESSIRHECCWKPSTNCEQQHQPCKIHECFEKLPVPMANSQGCGSGGPCGGGCRGGCGTPGHTCLPMKSCVPASGLSRRPIHLPLTSVSSRTTSHHKPCDVDPRYTVGWKDLSVGCECLGGGVDCQRCGLKVYQAEMQIVSGVPYHNICFSCYCCRKPLETLTYHENCGEIYCKQCYIRNFGPQGYGYSGVLQTPM